MNHNTNQDQFIFNFPTTFIQEELENKYKIGLENLHKPYNTVIDYTNSNIMNINMPGITFPVVEQTKIYGKQRKFRGAQSPYDVYQKELHISMKNVDFNMSYFILQDAMMNHYIKNRKKGSPFIDDFTVTILDEERRELYKLYFKELIPMSMSDFQLAYFDKDEKMTQYTVSFYYNKLDIEWLPHYADSGNDGEIIEEYTDRMIINDPDNNPADTYPDDRCEDEQVS